MGRLRIGQVNLGRKRLATDDLLSEVRERVPEYDIDYIVDQIKYDLNCSFSDLENNWKSTTNYRLNEIKNFSSTGEIFKNWNGYTLPLGYRLVDIDFRTLYLDCSSLLNTFENIVKLLDEKLKDSTNRKLFDSLRDDAFNNKPK
ncbi:hypothetical protein ACI65C_013394 [Semiaphis heraclei]